jgi:hypothetical protein
MRIWNLNVSLMVFGGCLLIPATVRAWQLITPTRRDILASTVYGGTLFSYADSTRAISTDPMLPGITAPLSTSGVARYQPHTVGTWDDLSTMVQSKLGTTRILAQELSLFSQPFFGDSELYYTPFLFGSWNVQATLMRKTYPYTTNYLVSRSLEEGSPRNREEKVGNTCTYEVHYFSTLANTLANQFTVNLGTGVPETKIIQDRAFNIVSISKAYDQLMPVQEVEWDYRKDPTYLRINFGAAPLGPDKRPLGPRRGEIFIQARQSEAVGDSVFCVAERSRSLTLAVRDALVSDTETITEFRQETPDHVTAVSRIAVYLTPNPNSREGILWQQTGGKAVAFFDYAINMQRKLEKFTNVDGSIVERPCVTTPKDVVQCS